MPQLPSKGLPPSPLMVGIRASTCEVRGNIHTQSTAEGETGPGCKDTADIEDNIQACSPGTERAHVSCGHRTGADWRMHHRPWKIMLYLWPTQYVVGGGISQEMEVSGKPTKLPHKGNKHPALVHLTEQRGLVH